MIIEKESCYLRLNTLMKLWQLRKVGIIGNYGVASILARAILHEPCIATYIAIMPMLVLLLVHMYVQCYFTSISFDTCPFRLLCFHGSIQKFFQDFVRREEMS